MLARAGIRKLFVRASVALLLTASALAIAPSTANAVTCWGNYCSGKDPMSSGCASDAYTVAQAFPGWATIDLRWSPTCKTNWARVYVYPTRTLAGGYITARQDTGYIVSGQIKSVTSLTPQSQTVWSPMIYSPVRCVKAGAVLGMAYDWNYTWTRCV